MPENFSCVVIARNESSTLPRLDASLVGVSDKVLLDTGSTDGTAALARSLGWNVIEVGNHFMREVTKEHIEKFENLFKFSPSFKEGERFFHFADARNHALTFAKNDWCFQPDCDEVVEWDIGKVVELIQNEDQLVYRFCFAHKPDGSCGLEFSHCKFFRRSRVMWKGFVHEICSPVPGETPKEPKFTDAIYHRHWQNRETKRGNYMGGLELGLLEDPTNDRNLFYTAREYFYLGQLERAIRMFDVALKVMWWKPERGQAYIFKALCHEGVGQSELAFECLHKSLAECDTRREPFFELAELHSRRGELNQAVSYYLAALGVPFRPHGYLNSMELYGWVIHDRLALLYHKLGAGDLSKEQWIKCLAFDDCDSRVLSNVHWYYKCPRISIVVPTCRPEGFQRLRDSIKRNTVYENYEIVDMPGEGTAVQKFNSGVEKATGELIVFMADDTEATPGWLEKAFVCLQERLNGRGLVIFNDGHWNGTLANHFLVNKSIREDLDGFIWNPKYFHNSVDCELYHRLNAKRLIAYAENAKIIHHHYFSPTSGKLPNGKDKWNERAEGWMEHDRRLLVRRMSELGFKKESDDYRRFFGFAEDV